MASETRLIAKLKTVQPVVETYIQQMQRDEDMGSVPKTDNYFLGKLDLSREVSQDSFIPAPGFFKRSIGAFTKFFSPDFLPRGFAQMVLMDEDGFDRQHYTFQYVRREFLGDVRCLVFDVVPEKSAGKGRFLGRIWVEDRDFHIVRFNGTYGAVRCGPTTRISIRGA